MLAIPSPLPQYVPSTAKPPPPPREFRGVWLATVANIDWPSKPGLPIAQQQLELRSLLDRAASANLNAIIFQVRPGCDALYESKLEPWSEYLTGQMGLPPSPFYDPLAFAIREAHARGLELHAWVNPFRARHPSAKSPVATNHISKTHPHLVKTYGRHLWLDPGEATARAYAQRVLMDIVKRYAVDGLHMDDYFYPYREKNEAGDNLDFPDDPSWQQYQKGGGQLAKSDWRRNNVNRFVEQLYASVKAEKPWVKVGISPFGIWRNQTPAGITGLDAYEQLFADSRRWLEQGWLDYLAPQLYWAIDAPGQSFPVLFKWWKAQNPKARPVWPGLNAYKSGQGWPPEEIARQIEIARQQKAPGHILWRPSPALGSATNNLRRVLLAGPFADRAVVPAMPWLSSKAPPPPKVYFGGNAGHALITLTLEAPGARPPAWWVVRSGTANRWQTEILDGTRRLTQLPGPDYPATIAIHAMNHFGQLSPPVVMERKQR